MNTASIYLWDKNQTWYLSAFVLDNSFCQDQYFTVTKAIGIFRWILPNTSVTTRQKMFSNCWTYSVQVQQNIGMKKKKKVKKTPLNSFFQQFQNKLYQHLYKTTFQPLIENTRPPWNSCQICKPLLPTTQAAPGHRETALFHARCCCLPWMKSWGSHFFTLSQLKDWTDSGLPFNRLLT